MIVAKLLALPVIIGVAIMAAHLELIQTGNVKLYNQKRTQVNIGDVLAEETTVGQLKKLVASRNLIELASVRLTTTEGIPLLYDEELLSEYLSIYSSELILYMRDDLTKADSINIEFRDDKFELVVTKNKSLSWLKQEALDEVNPDDYRVFYQNRELTNDSKTLGEYQLYKGASVFIFHKNDTYKITIVPLIGRNRKLEVALDTDVEDLMKIVEESGVEIENQLMVHYGKVIRGQTKLYSLPMYPFHVDYVIHMVERLGESGDEVTVFQKKPEQISYFNVFIKPSDTLGELKKIAFEVDNSIPVEEMQMTLAGSSLVGDSRKLGEFDIYPDARIRVSRQRK